MEKVCGFSKTSKNEENTFLNLERILPIWLVFTSKMLSYTIIQRA